MSNKQINPSQPTKQPVHIRRNVESFTDPYISEEHLPEGSECKCCRSIYSSGRWYTPEKAPESVAHLGTQELFCPACRKLQDHVPGGVLKIIGSFVWGHKDEMMNLIRNECSKALAVNPLERIMSLQSDDAGIEITTTNEKLAQRIGRALHKAYRGTVEYKWSGDTKLVRVVWQRNL